MNKLRLKINRFSFSVGILKFKTLTVTFKKAIISIKTLTIEKIVNAGYYNRELFYYIEVQYEVDADDHIKSPCRKTR